MAVSDPGSPAPSPASPLAGAATPTPKRRRRKRGRPAGSSYKATLQKCTEQMRNHKIPAWAERQDTDAARLSDIRKAVLDLLDVVAGGGSDNLAQLVRDLAHDLSIRQDPDITRGAVPPNILPRVVEAFNNAVSYSDRAGFLQYCDGVPLDRLWHPALGRSEVGRALPKNAERHFNGLHGLQRCFNGLHGLQKKRRETLQRVTRVTALFYGDSSLDPLSLKIRL